MLLGKPFIPGSENGSCIHLIETPNQFAIYGYPNGTSKYFKADFDCDKNNACKPIPLSKNLDIAAKYGWCLISTLFVCNNSSEIYIFFYI